MKLRENHKQAHIRLHKCLDELVADFISTTKKRPSQATGLELMEWSGDQAETAKPLP